MHAPDGLDAFVDVLDEGSPIVVADLGAGGGAPVQRWFASMFTSVAQLGVAFTAIGLVTPDPASVESVLSWAAALQHRVRYLIVKNSLNDPADFGYWDHDPGAVAFREAFRPEQITMEYRLPKVEHPAREHGVTIGGIANSAHDVTELRSTSVRVRAQAYRRHMFAELDRVKNLLLL
jgi:hypothetical protein